LQQGAGSFDQAMWHVVSLALMSSSVIA